MADKKSDLRAYRGASLTGRVAVVTGSSRGIGAAIAKELAARGAHLAVTSRTRESAQTVADEITSASGEARAYAADLTVGSTAPRLIEEVVRDFGRLDVLVNNAGIGMVRSTLDLTLEDWTAALTLDLTASFQCAQAAARQMIPAGGGVIVNIGSIFGSVGMPLRAAYCAAKHGLSGLTKALALEWAPHFIRVVQVNPAFVETEFVQESMWRGSFAAEDVNRRTPAGRIGQPAEVARAVAFLASDEAAYITGTELLVDGGWVANGSW